MGELKRHQPSMSIDEQVENLKSLGLVISVYFLLTFTNEYLLTLLLFS